MIKKLKRKILSELQEFCFVFYFKYNEWFSYFEMFGYGFNSNIIISIQRDPQEEDFNTLTDGMGNFEIGNE